MWMRRLDPSCLAGGVMNIDRKGRLMKSTSDGSVGKGTAIKDQPYLICRGCFITTRSDQQCAAIHYGVSLSRKPAIG